jgi:hypothetical protein
MMIFFVFLERCRRMLMTNSFGNTNDSVAQLLFKLKIGRVLLLSIHYNLNGLVSCARGDCRISRRCLLRQVS